jgi:hypothetical protein
MRVVTVNLGTGRPTSIVAEIPFEDGMRDLLVWLEGQEVVDTVDTAREALLVRGLAR